MEAKYEGYIFLDYVVTDDDTKMKNIYHMLNIVQMVRRI